jgi:hypothetical protein
MSVSRYYSAYLSAFSETVLAKESKQSHRLPIHTKDDGEAELFYAAVSIGVRDGAGTLSLNTPKSKNQLIEIIKDLVG